MNLSEVEHKQKRIRFFLRLGDFFRVMKMMAGSALTDSQIQQIVDRVTKITFIVIDIDRSFSFSD